MNSETYLDFCFVREFEGGFSSTIDKLLTNLFSGMRVNWYLEEKATDGAEIVVAEVKGMTRFQSERDAVMHIETHAEEEFWTYLQGYKMVIYPNGKGCGSSCGSH